MCETFQYMICTSCDTPSSWMLPLVPFMRYRVDVTAICLENEAEGKLCRMLLPRSLSNSPSVQPVWKPSSYHMGKGATSEQRERTDPMPKIWRSVAASPHAHQLTKIWTGTASKATNKKDNSNWFTIGNITKSTYHALKIAFLGLVISISVIPIFMCATEMVHQWLETVTRNKKKLLKIHIGI